MRRKHNKLVSVELCAEEIRRLISTLAREAHGGEFPQPGCIMCALCLRLQAILEREFPKEIEENELSEMGA